MAAMSVVAVLALLLSVAPADDVDVDPALLAFAQVPADPEPAAITRGQHYWIGNEDRLDLFHGEIADIGGIHIGVGAEQNWLLCGWSRCEVLVLVDFDQAIVDLHHAYIATIAATPTRQAFVDLWFDRSRKASRAAIITRYSGREALGALKAVDVARWSIERRFNRLMAQMKAHDLPSFLTDDAQYEHLHALAVRGRVFAVRGDLTAKKTLQAIGAAATSTQHTVRSLYLSNAEQYFSYNKQTRKNLLSLPMDDRSVVVRTHGSNALDYVEGGNSYHYGVQTGPSFRAFVADTHVTSSHQILQWAPTATEPGTSKQTSLSPTEAKTAWRATKQQKARTKTTKTKTKTP